MDIKDRFFWGHYDDIGDPEWHYRNGFGKRYRDLNGKRELSELEQKELKILAEGTEEEFLAFLKDNGIDKSKYEYDPSEELTELEQMELEIFAEGTEEECKAFLKKHRKELKRLGIL